MSTAGMEEIKDLVSHALEQKRVLSRLKAELRAQVFLAIDEQERGAGNPGLAQKTENARRAALLKSEQGPLVIGLVKEFLEWSGMEFTLRVFEPEIGHDTPLTRQALAKKLGIPDGEVSLDKPLLEVFINHRQDNKQGPTSAQQPLPSTTARPQPTSVPVQSLQQQQQQQPQSISRTAATGVAIPQPVQQQEASTTSLISDVNDDENLQNAEDEEEDYAAVFTHQRETRASISADGVVSHGPAAAVASQQSGIKPTTTLQQGRRSVELSGSELQENRRRRTTGSSDEDSDLQSSHHSSPRHDAARRSHDGGKHEPYPAATTTSTTTTPAGGAGMTLSGKLNALAAPPSLPTRLGALAPLTAGKPPGGIGDLSVGGRKGAEDIKAELRKAGLLNSDSYSIDVKSEHASDDGGDDDNDDESIGSLELPDSSQQAAVRHSSSGGGASSDSGFIPAHVPARRLSNSSGLSALAPPPPTKLSNPSATAGAHGVIRPVHGGVFDAEVTISQSMEIPADVLESDEDGDNDDVFSDGSEVVSRPSGPGGKYQTSKGVSMDLKQTGLSASDRSGDLDTVLEHADLQETAEWA